MGRTRDMFGMREGLMRGFALLKEGLLFCVAVGLWIVYRAWMATLRPTVVNPQFLPSRLPKGENAIYVFWHAKSFGILPYASGSRMAALTLLDWKNRIYDGICRLFGCRTISVRSVSKATAHLVRLLEEGYHVALALDGPRGPLGVIKPGALYLSMKTGKPLVAVNVKIAFGIRLWWRWDRFEIPLPFSRWNGHLSEPIDVRRIGWEAALSQLKAALPDR